MTGQYKYFLRLQVAGLLARYLYKYKYNGVSCIIHDHCILAEHSGELSTSTIKYRMYEKLMNSPHFCLDTLEPGAIFSFVFVSEPCGSTTVKYIYL